MEMSLFFPFGFVRNKGVYAAARLQHIHAINVLHVSVYTHVTRNQKLQM
jgi:hypothetical protein